MFNYYYFFNKVKNKDEYLVKRMKKVSLYGIVDIMSKVKLSDNFFNDFVAQQFSNNNFIYVASKLSQEQLSSLFKLNKIPDKTRQEILLKK